MKSHDKDTDSIGTVQMKTDYAHSEVYSTASEAPPVYMKRQSSSIKIAKIAACTVILSSFIIGAFILASTYLQARTTCSQMELLDNILEKEMNYEAKQNAFKAEALVGGAENAIVANHKATNDNSVSSGLDSSSSSSSSDDDNSETSESESENHHHQVVIKMPLQMNPSDMVNAFMAHNDKSRMNCVVERRITEEEINEPSQKLELPLGLNVMTRPKKGQVTGERMVIKCDSGKSDEDRSDDPFDGMKPMIIPIGRFNLMPPMHREPIPYGDIPRFSPLTHMPQQHLGPLSQQQPPQMFPPMFRNSQMPPQMFNKVMPNFVPEPPTHEVPPPPPPSQEPHAEQNPFEHFLPARNLFSELEHAAEQNNNNNNNEMQQEDIPAPRIRIQIHRIPLRDLFNDGKPENDFLRQLLRPSAPEGVEEQKPADNQDNGEDSNEELPQLFNVIRQMMHIPMPQSSQESDNDYNDGASSASSSSSSSSSSANDDKIEMAPPAKTQTPNQDDEQKTTEENGESDMMPLKIMPFGDPIHAVPNTRIIFGRSLLNPIRIPVPMDQEQADMKSTILNPTNEKIIEGSPVEAN